MASSPSSTTATPPQQREAGPRPKRGASMSASKRLWREYMELQADPCPEFIAYPMEDDLLDWHFTVRGPNESGFQGGRYHGRIVFPIEYPCKPPSIYFLTPNGRFSVNTKICLSITGYHPEYWRPAWGVRLALIAIISFFPTKSEGAIGGLDYPEEERVRLAALSKTWTCPSCHKCNSDALPDESVVPQVALKGAEELLREVKFTGKLEGSVKGSGTETPTGTSGREASKPEATSSPVSSSSSVPPGPLPPPLLPYQAAHPASLTRSPSAISSTTPRRRVRRSTLTNDVVLAILFAVIAYLLARRFL